MQKKLFGIFLVALLGGWVLLAPSCSQEAPTTRWGRAEPAWQKLQAAFTGQVAVLQNFTLSDRTILTVLQPHRKALALQVVSATGVLSSANVQSKVTAINSDFDIVELNISGLASDQVYGLEVRDDTGALLDTREFQSLNSEKKEPVIAIASCARVGWMGKDFGPRSIWDELQDQQPDVLLFLGDMVYPDTTWQALLHRKPTDREIEFKYIEAWQEVRLYHQFRLLPVFAVMDDHDYGFQGANSKNNGDRQDEMLRFFRTFYPIPSGPIAETFERGVGAAFRVNLFGFDVFLLDNKYARIASNETGDTGPIWGKLQLEWLGQHLSRSQHESLIGSGTLFSFPRANQDAAEYESPREFENLKLQLQKSQKHFVLMSGDVHYSAVQKMPAEKYGFSSFEIIASRIHSVSPLIIPPFISGYVGPEQGQSIHTAEKNFTILRPKERALGGAVVEIHIKNEPESLSTRLSF